MTTFKEQIKTLKDKIEKEMIDLPYDSAGQRKYFQLSNSKFYLSGLETAAYAGFEPTEDQIKIILSNY